MVACRWPFCEELAVLAHHAREREDLRAPPCERARAPGVKGGAQRRVDLCLVSVRTARGPPGRALGMSSTGVYHGSAMAVVPKRRG